MCKPSRIALGCLGLATRNFRVFETFRMSTTKPREGGRLGIGRSDKTPLLQNRFTSSCGEATGAAVNIYDVEVVLNDESDKRLQEPPNTVSRPLKGDVATVLKAQCCDAKNMFKGCYCGLTSPPKLFRILWAISMFAHFLPRAPNRARQGDV